MSEDTNEKTSRARDHGVCCEAGGAIEHLLRRLRPSEQASGHFRQSRIEFLEGLRTLLDERIDHLGRAPHKGTRVVVE
jgi:hypothetical protein